MPEIPPNKSVPNKTVDKHQQTLENNHTLLVHNIILTEDFFSVLVEQKVLNPALVSDIKREKTREASNVCLLESISKLGSRAFSKFVDCLHLTGHTLLSDLLRDDDITSAVKADAKMADIFKKFPTLSRILSAYEQHQLITYIQQKLSDATTKVISKVNDEEKVRAMSDRQDFLETDRQKVKTIKDKDRQILTLAEHVNSAEAMITKLQTELKDLRKDQHHQKAKHGEQMMNMVRSNDAQEKATHKNDEKIKLYDAKVRKVNIEMAQFFGDEERDAQHDADNVTVGRMEKNVMRMIKTARGLELDVDHLQNERITTRASMIDIAQLTDRGQPFNEVFIEACARFMSQLKVLRTKFIHVRKTLHMNSDEDEQEPTNVRTSVTIKNFDPREIDRRVGEMTLELDQVQHHVNNLKTVCVDKDDIIEKLEEEIRRLTESQMTVPVTPSPHHREVATAQVVEYDGHLPIIVPTEEQDWSRDQSFAAGRVLSARSVRTPVQHLSPLKSERSKVITPQLVLQEGKELPPSASPRLPSAEISNNRSHQSPVAVNNVDTHEPMWQNNTSTFANAAHKFESATPENAPLNSTTDQDINFIRKVEFSNHSSYPRQMKSYETLPKIQPKAHQPYPLRPVPTGTSKQNYKMRYESNVQGFVSKSHPMYQQAGAMHDPLTGTRRTRFQRTVDVEAPYLPIPVPPRYRLDIGPPRPLPSDPKIPAGIIKLNKLHFTQAPTTATAAARRR